MSENSTRATRQAEMSINAFYIAICEQRVHELQAGIDNGSTQGEHVYQAQAIIRAYNKRLIELRMKRQVMRWETAS